MRMQLLVLVVLLSCQTAFAGSFWDRRLAAMDRYCWGFDQKEIRAIIYVESMNRTNAIRDDARSLTNRGWVSNVIRAFGLDRGDRSIYCSYGLTQILYLNAVTYGYRGPPPGLKTVSSNIKYGGRMWRCLKRQYPRLSFEERVHLWNAGHLRFHDVNRNGRKDPGETWFSQAYVTQVMRYYMKIGGSR
jgi:hypothetical protein